MQKDSMHSEDNQNCIFNRSAYPLGKSENLLNEMFRVLITLILKQCPV